MCWQAWPPINAVRELATKLKTRVKSGEKNVFLVAELRNYVACVFVRILLASGGMPVVQVSAALLPGALRRGTVQC